MARSRQFSLSCALVALAGLGLPSCRSTERELVERLMEAAARGDRQTVAQLSLVKVPEVQEFRVLTITKPTRTPYPVPPLRQRVADAEKERDRQFRAFGDFRNQNYDDLARIQRLRRQDPEAPLPGRLPELSRQWEAFREERREVVRRLHEEQQALEWEVRKVTKALQRESTPEYLVGEAIEEQARVSVRARGEPERIYVLILTTYDLENQLGAVVPTRWVVTEIFPETL